ncbi:MAG: DUF4430 domain-containing protein [Atopobiaceae bacterium]|nr:DUF4430 domain-containing protein [Atopobiaceae bacterium]
MRVRACAMGTSWLVALMCAMVLVLAMPARLAWADDAPKAEQQDAAKAEQQDAAAEQTRRITPAVKKTIRVSVRFVGLEGPWAAVRGLELAEGASAWDATRRALMESDLAYRTGAEATQDVIVSLTKEDGSTLAADFSTGSGWHLYLNGDRFQGSSSKVELEDADKIEWRYEMGTIMVTVSVVGPGGTGDSYWIPPTGVRLDASQNGWDATLTVFEQNGYAGRNSLTYTNGPNGEVWLDALAALGEDGITGESWQLFVNGSLAPADIAHVDLRAGDSICWYYAGRGVASLPSFVSRTGAAAQNPATAVSIEGVVGQTWTNATSATVGGYRVLDRAAGLSLAGEDAARTLVWEGHGLMDPAAQSLADVGWRQSLANVLEGKLQSGEGGRSLMGLDGSLYYLSDQGSVVRLDAR